MKRRLITLILLGVPFAAYLLFASMWTASPAPAKTAKVVREPLAVWSSYEGTLESRTVRMIMSNFRGNATVIQLAADGAKVSTGDVLVRFDSSALERDVLKLERDYTLAQSELDSLKYAEIPLELRDLEMTLTETRSTLSAEQQYLDASIELAKEELVSAQEVEQQKDKVAEITAQLQTVELQLQLTREHLHPSALKRAQAKLASAEQQLTLARKQVQNSVVRAPSDGVVVYKPLHIGTDFRMIRVGDTVYPNQPFMVLPYMKDLVVHCQVPEAELSRVAKGKDVFIQPLAYPGMRLRGVVETVGSTAENAPGRPAWQKFFHVVIALIDADRSLRPGMSVTAHILSYYKADAISIPRAAVRWEAGKPFGKVVTPSSHETRLLTLGMANERNYEVIEGLQPGTVVLIE